MDPLPPVSPLLACGFSRALGIAVTSPAAKLLWPLCQAQALDLLLPRTLADEMGWTAETPGLKLYDGPLGTVLEDVWPNYRGLIFALATGAVVRLIAPLLRSKADDPAVVVMDSRGQWAISLVGGHQGGADGLSRWLADYMGATAILTGGSAGQGQIPVDQWGDRLGWRRGDGQWTKVSAAWVEQKPIAIFQEGGSDFWRKQLPQEGPRFAEIPTDGAATVWITPRLKPLDPERPEAVWHPRVLWIGVGCVRGTPEAVIHRAITQTLQGAQLSPLAIAGLASVDIKEDEAGLRTLAQQYQVPFITFSAEILQRHNVPNPSAVVAAEVGTPSVAEAAALEAASQQGEGRLRVEKHIFRETAGSVTVAIAESSQEWIGHPGKLWLVGTGPGELSQLSSAARTAIGQADVLIGYGLYLELIAPLIQPGQIIETFPLTQERQRCQRAIALARWGLTVAVLSSGDCGIYGMAGLALEELHQTGWDGQTPAVEVFPGISAFQAVAAKVGAPLMHDFCAISLSDLLTPRPTILQRLTAAAQGDFVIALYNPKSQKRTELIERAQEILLAWRSPQTPVVLARSVYRPDEHIIYTTLGNFLNHPIDMLTLVLIGNQNTYRHHQYIITPRGYSPPSSAGTVPGG